MYIVRKLWGIKLTKGKGGVSPYNNISHSPVRIRSPQRQYEYWAPVSLSQKTSHHLITKMDGHRGRLSPRHEGGKVI